MANEAMKSQQKVCGRDGKEKCFQCTKKIKVIIRIRRGLVRRVRC